MQKNKKASSEKLALWYIIKSSHTIKYQGDFIMNTKQFQLVLPLNTKISLPKDDPVILLNDVLDSLSYQELNSMYSHLGRKPVTSPKTLFKIIVYAYMNHIYSSRKIERSCKRDIAFMWLLNGEPAPDNNTICRFRSSRVGPVLENLFNQLVIKLGEMNEIEYSNIYIDGTKLEANANKYTFVWKKSISKFEVKLLEKANKIVNSINSEFHTIFELDSKKLDTDKLQEISTFLEGIKSNKNIEFVYGKGKRKSSVQRFTEQILECLDRQLKYNDYNNTFDGRNSFSKTDKDATFMRMKDDHMRNSQLKPGYNIQIGVEGEYIVGVDITSERSDQLTLIPFLDKLNKNLPKKYDNIVADAGYESEENYEYLRENQHISYIKPNTYETMKKRDFKKKIGKKENMKYIAKSDEYICANNRTLKFKYPSIRTSKSGYTSKIKVYECKSCDGCEIKSKCTRAKGNRQIHVSPVFDQRRKESLENITSKDGVILRMNRSIQVEGTFGVLKQDYGFRRFLTRGKANVKIEFLLLSLGYNINKLHNKKLQNRCGVALHKKLIA